VEKIDMLANEARESISDFCINECKAFCCRDGFLIVSEEELDLIVGDKKEALLEDGSVEEKMFGKKLLNLKLCNGCPSLENNMCKIHKDHLRPNTCKDFPIFIVGKEIKISSRCPAKYEGKFFKFEKEAEKLGYKIVDNFSFN
jgi:Fe-S-cluster containining protein